MLDLPLFSRNGEIAMTYGATDAVFHTVDRRRRDWSGVLVGVVIGVVATTSLRGETVTPRVAPAAASAPPEPRLADARAEAASHPAVLASRATHCTATVQSPRSDSLNEHPCLLTCPQTI